MSGPQAGNMMKKVETDDTRVGEEIQMNEPKVGQVWRSARVGQQEYLKPQQDAMPAEIGEEHGRGVFEKVDERAKHSRESRCKWGQTRLVCGNPSSSPVGCTFCPFWPFLENSKVKNLLLNVFFFFFLCFFVFDPFWRPIQK